MKTEFVNNLTRSFNRFGLKVKKHSPEILLGVGIVGGVTSAVMACKATTKASTILENTKKNIDAIHTCLETPELAEEYTAEDGKKDMAIVYAQTGLEFAKLYGPSILLGVASIGCIIASHNISRKRILALGAAYAAEATGFKEYRGRVIERFGKELDRELKYNIKAKEVEEVVRNEDGTETVVTKTIEVAEGPINSPYTVCFDETCTGWTRNAEDNKFFLLQQQNWANERLKEKGHLFLNEVYDMIGAQRTRAGQIVGWVYDKDNQVGDNYVDFGIYNIYSEPNRKFVNGLEKSIWLEFNVDGDVMKLLK